MDKISLFSIKIQRTNLKETLNFIADYDFEQTGYICLPDMSVIADAQKDPRLKSILNNSLRSLPDGKPLEIIAKLKGYKEISTVSGYWLIKSLMDSSLQHYFYGATEETCSKLHESLIREFPSAHITGYKSPPFLGLQEIEGNSQIQSDILSINQLKPDIIWVGISSPKQDYLMHSFHKQLNHGIMIGVGGVFDYLAGTHKISPEWIKRIGMRWFYRLLQSPKRLWRKYFKTMIFILSYPFLRLFPKNTFWEKH